MTRWFQEKELNAAPCHRGQPSLRPIPQRMIARHQFLEKNWEFCFDFMLRLGQHNSRLFPLNFEDFRFLVFSLNGLALNERNAPLHRDSSAESDSSGRLSIAGSLKHLIASAERCGILGRSALSRHFQGIF
jgi:hypothetical protein